MQSTDDVDIPMKCTSEAKMMLHMLVIKFFLDNDILICTAYYRHLKSSQTWQRVKVGYDEWATVLPVTMSESAATLMLLSGRAASIEDQVQRAWDTFGQEL